jgi:SAM-dependent methyltransferase
MYADRLAGYDWWGWIDLDVAVGDLDRLFGPLLESHDVITTDPDYLHGPLTLLRNTKRCVDLFRWGDEWLLAEMLSDPDYWNFDEDGFDNPDNPSISSIVEASGIPTYYDDRCWTEGRWTIEDGLPARCCELKDGKLLEMPTGRELVLYHFTSKRWPIPAEAYSRYNNLRALQQAWQQPPKRPEGEESPAYWSGRLRETRGTGGPLHTAVYDAPQGDWNLFQQQTAAILKQHVRVGHRVLDCGCGYGALVECLDAAGLPAYLVGVDYCPGMIRLGRYLHQSCMFLEADITSMPLPDRSFDWAVCRGLEGTAKTLKSNRYWVKMRQEMLRVARRLLLIDNAGGWRVVER